MRLRPSEARPPSGPPDLSKLSTFQKLYAAYVCACLVLVVAGQVQNAFLWTAIHVRYSKKRRRRFDYHVLEGVSFNGQPLKDLGFRPNEAHVISSCASLNGVMLSGGRHLSKHTHLSHHSVLLEGDGGVWRTSFRRRPTPRTCAYPLHPTSVVGITGFAGSLVALVAWAVLKPSKNAAETIKGRIARSS